MFFNVSFLVGGIEFGREIVSVFRVFWVVGLVVVDGEGEIFRLAFGK